LPLEPFKQYLEKKGVEKGKEDVDLTVLIQKGNSETKLIDQENLVFQTETDLELRLVEQNAGIVLKDNHVIKLLEKEVEQKLKGKDITREEWREKFPEIDVKFNVNADIIRHGVTE